MFFRILLFALLLLANFTTAQWSWQNPLPQGNSINDIEFIDNYFGLAVGETGTILKTTDGGITWSQQNSTTTKVIYNVDVTNNSIAYALGSYFLLKTTDGGDSWFNLEMPATTYFNDLFFLDSLKGYVVGSNSNIFYTYDGGSTWIQRYEITSDNLKVINFFNEKNGIAIGFNLGFYENFVLKTTNGGYTWSRSTISSELNDVEFVTETKLIAVANDNIFYSTDGGQNWISSKLASNIYSKSIDFIDSLNGIICGYSDITSSARIFRTRDAGQTWQEIVFNLGGGAWLNTVSFPTNNFIYAAGGNGRMIRSIDGGNYWEQISNGPLNSLYDISFFDENNGIAAGWGILRTTDGGNNWEITSNASPLYRCISPWQNTYFAIGGYNLLKSTDGGLTWNRNPVSDDNYFMTIAFADTLNGVASTLSGSEPKIFRTFDGGETWQQVSTLQGFPVYDICYINPSIIFASAGSAVVYKSTDGGYNWNTLFTSGNNTILYGIDFVNSLVGYTVGFPGVVIKTTDGGVNWQTLNVNLGNGLGFERVDFIDENNGIVGGDIVAHTSDGGITWERYDLFQNSIYSATMANDSVWYAVGESGAILKRKPNSTIPVELIRFDCTVSISTITVNWQTATEANNQGFNIERRKRQYERSEEWENLGFIKGQGTTTEPQSYSFVDKNLSAGKYQYRLKQLDFDGSFEYSNTIEVEIESPTKFILEQNYPNPFNPSTKITYAIPQNSFVELKVFNLLGQEIATLVNEEKPAGTYEVNFSAIGGSASGGNASNLPSGVYIYKMKAGEYLETRKMILLK